MASSTARPALGPVGKSRRPGLMPLLYVVTGSIYFLYWLYKTIQELRAHSPGCTHLEPGSTIARCFIPFYNIYWFFHVMRELPRAIARVRRDAACDGRWLDAGFVTRWYATDLVAGNIACAMNMAALPLFLGVHFYPLVAWQRILNAHWELVRAKGAEAVSVPVPPVALDPAPEQSLHQALGVSGPSIDWSAVWSFIVAAVAAEYFIRIVGEGWMRERTITDTPWIFWLSAAGYAALRAGTIAYVFRRLRTNAAAAAIAAGGLFACLAIFWYWVIRWLGPISAGAGFSSSGPLVGHLADRFVYTELLVIALVLALRWFRPAWFALWMGTLAFMVLDELLDTLSGASSVAAMIKTSYEKGLWVVPYAFGFALTWYLARRFARTALPVAVAAGVLALVVPASIGAYEAFRPKRIEFSLFVNSDVAPASRFKFTVEDQLWGDHQAGDRVPTTKPVPGRWSTSYDEGMLPAMSGAILYPCGWRPAKLNFTPPTEQQLRSAARSKFPMNLSVTVGPEQRPDVVRIIVDNRVQGVNTRVALGEDERLMFSWASPNVLTFPAPDCEAGGIVRVNGQEVGRVPVTTSTSSTTLSAVSLTDPAADAAATRDYLVDPLGTRCYALREVPGGVSGEDQPARGTKYPEKRFGAAAFHRLPPVNIDFALGPSRPFGPRYSGSTSGKVWLVEAPCS
jgi:hypothetical protein